MRHWMRNPWLATAYCLTLSACTAGCTSRPGNAERYVPEPAIARAAVEAALNEWQLGRPPGEIKGLSPAVQVVDTHRKAGQQLEKFEILGEVGGDAGRCISVRVALADPHEELRIRFIVIGINPLWVFRDEDFTMLTHWDHPMTDEP
jgi:hypothetical protein